MDRIYDLETQNTLPSKEHRITTTLTDEDGAERDERKVNDRINIQIKEFGSVISNMLEEYREEDKTAHFDAKSDDAESYMTSQT